MVFYFVAFLALLSIQISGEYATKYAFRGCADVKLITFTSPASLLLTGLPFTGPAITLALEEVRLQYGLNLTNDFITRSDLLNCEDMVGAAYLVAEYIYLSSSDTCYIMLNPVTLVWLWINNYYKICCNKVAKFNTGEKGCDDEIPLGRLSNEWNIPILTSGTIYPVFYDPSEFPTMVSFGGVDLQQLSQGLLDVFQYFSWSSVAVVHDVSPEASAVYPGIARLLKSSLSTYSQFILFPVDTSNNRTIHHQQIIARIRPVSRVVLLLVVAEQARAFMVAVRKFEKHPDEYVFICAEPFHSVRRLGELTWQVGDQDDQVAKMAFRSLLHITSSCGTPGSNPEQYVMDRIKSDGIAKYNASYVPNEETNEISMSAYYSVKTLGEVLNQATLLNASLCDGRALAARFSNRSFVFHQRRVVINSSRAVMTYDALTRKLQPITGRTLDWDTPTNRPPKNEPKCGFSGDKSDCPRITPWDSSSIIAAIIPILLVACLGVGVVRWYIHRQRSRDAIWRIQTSELVFR